MKTTRKGLGTLIVSATLLGALGCGEEAAKPAVDDKQKSEATVTGSVTIKGKPASKGRVTFEPLGADGMPTDSQSAGIKDGAFTIKTKPGNNDVTVSSTGDAAIDSGYNKTSVAVQPGENKVTLELPFKQ
jgi:hypothetical protein